MGMNVVFAKHNTDLLSKYVSATEPRLKLSWANETVLTGLKSPKKWRTQSRALVRCLPAPFARPLHPWSKSRHPPVPDCGSTGLECRQTWKNRGVIQPDFRGEGKSERCRGNERRLRVH